MIAVHRPDATLDLTDDVTDATDGTPVDRTDDVPHPVRAQLALVVENTTLRESLQRLLAIVDRQAADRDAISDLRARLGDAEDTIEDLIAIIVASRASDEER